MVMFKGLTFGGINSKDYGVYIEGESAFNAPQRDVELIEIPGRNGAYVHDMGRYSNIEVSYPAGLFGHSESEFAEKISNFRNAICSKKGYQKLTDDYNPNEYRMGVYSSGLDVKPAILRAGEFELKFNCKPQRFLTSGDTPVSLDSGDTLTNPTLFESKPLIECKGYGDIGIGDKTISITLEPLGNIILKNKGWSQITLDSTKYKTGDVISIQGGSSAVLKYKASRSDLAFTATAPEGVGYTWQISSDWLGSFYAFLSLSLPQMDFVAGTDETKTFTVEWTVEGQTFNTVLTVVYANETLTFSVTGPTSVSTLLTNGTITSISGETVRVNSTVIPGVDTIIIDLDIGEAYMIVDDVPVSLNNSVILGATPPTLMPGDNEITYDNTITDFQVTPRYWKL